MGLAERLGIGRHSTFVATVTVHELSQVPLVAAKFRIKWKFKGATSAHNLGDYDSDSDAGGSATTARRLLHPKSALRHSSGEHSNSTLRRSLSPLTIGSSSGAEGHATDDDWRTSPPPLSPNDTASMLRTPNPNKTPNPSHASAFAFTSPFGSSNEPIYSNASSAAASPAQGNTPDDSPSSASNMARRRGGADLAYLPPPTSPHHSRAEPKGSTSLLPLRNHTVTFQREIHCPVSIPVKNVTGSEKYQLQASVVKLSIRQEVIGDDGHKTETRAGDVLLDLSQFAGVNGKRNEAKPRRYLLRECKTNATLRVTVSMDFVSGESNYTAPPLRTGQLPAGSASGLASSGSSSFSKSSTSLVSKGKGRPKSSSSSVSMSRTASSSSFSGASEKSSSHSGSHASGKSRGWHPSPANTGQSFSNSPSPGLLGGSNEHDRNANDIIDTIFNKGPRRQTSWNTNSGPTTPSAEVGSNNNTLASDTLVFSLGNQGRSATGSGARAPSEAGGKAKQSHRWHGLRHASSPVPRSTPVPPSAVRASGHDSQASSRSSSLRLPPSSSSASTSPDRPTFARRSSLSSSQSSASRNLSVRWTDDRSAHRATSASSLRDAYHRSDSTETKTAKSKASALDIPTTEPRPRGGTGILRSPTDSASSSSSNLSDLQTRDFNRKDFKINRYHNDDDDDDDNNGTREAELIDPPTFDRRMTLKPSSSSLKQRVEQNVSQHVTSRTLPKPTTITPKGQVEWAKSWG
ncbi:hypothetical protein OIO90_002069 [Microbotryomycetes sp. JL221]|nr:hypothetical protein OIO90_002069 [Microbotryomycetes sp. JL221]